MRHQQIFLKLRHIPNSCCSPATVAMTNPDQSAFLAPKALSEFNPIQMKDVFLSWHPEGVTVSQNFLYPKQQNVKPKRINIGVETNQLRRHPKQLLTSPWLVHWKNSFATRAVPRGGCQELWDSRLGAFWKVEGLKFWRVGFFFRVGKLENINKLINS